VSRTVRCRTCGHWFTLSEEGCPTCQFFIDTPSPELGPMTKLARELSENDRKLLRALCILPKLPDDDGA
jgi:hypothetical protein